VRSLRMVGAMADLVPPQQIAELTALLGAPYLNSFGSTETGLPPASAALLPAGEVPVRLSQARVGCAACAWSMPTTTRCRSGTPGELTIRSPTLFSGYWNARRDQRATSAAAGSTWATCSCATPTARWTSSTVPST
jgi:acyl-coenzyme A synthetase/AMP-(fatty) acid ligase